LNPTLKKVLPNVIQTLPTPKIPLKTNLDNLPKKPAKETNQKMFEQNEERRLKLDKLN
jgi:hypothetical protein